MYNLWIIYVLCLVLVSVPAMLLQASFSLYLHLIVLVQKTINSTWTAVRPKVFNNEQIFHSTTPWNNKSLQAFNKFTPNVCNWIIQSTTAEIKNCWYRLQIWQWIHILKGYKNAEKNQGPSAEINKSVAHPQTYYNNKLLWFILNNTTDRKNIYIYILSTHTCYHVDLLPKKHLDSELLELYTRTQMELNKYKERWSLLDRIVFSSC